MTPEQIVSYCKSRFTSLLPDQAKQQTVLSQSVIVTGLFVEFSVFMSKEAKQKQHFAIESCLQEEVSLKQGFIWPQNFIDQEDKEKFISVKCLELFL